MPANFDQAEYLRAIVARDDPDYYLLSLFAPRRVRQGLWAVIAFNHDLATVQTRVQEPTLGLMRLQWWRDALDRMAGAVIKGHPVAEGIAPLCADDQVRACLHALIDAHEFDVTGQEVTTLEGLESYAEYTSTPVLAVMTRLCGVDINDVTSLRYLAIAFGLMQIVRAVPFDVKTGQKFLPRDLIADASVDLARLHEPAQQEKLIAVIAAITQSAQDHVLRAADLPPLAMVRAARAMTRIHIRHLAHAGHNIFSPRFLRPPRCLAARVWLASFGR